MQGEKVIQNILKTFILIFLFSGASPIIYAQSVSVAETPDHIRFEQYTGTTNSGQVYFWRLPTPGVSVFPGSSCLRLQIPADKPEHSSRFMALYLFAKTNGKQIFYYFDAPTCSIISFAMDG